MDDALLVRRFERVGDLPGDPDRFIDRQRTARQPIRQRLSVHELEDEALRRAGGLEAVDGRDLRVIQRGEDLRLTLEAREAVGVLAERGRQDFQRDVATERHIARAIHLAHPAGAERRDDFIGAEASTRTQGHRSGLILALTPRRKLASEGRRPVVTASAKILRHILSS